MNQKKKNDSDLVLERRFLSQDNSVAQTAMTNQKISNKTWHMYIY